jgi:hypothetical protein
MPTNVPSAGLNSLKALVEYTAAVEGAVTDRVKLCDMVAACAVTTLNNPYVATNATAPQTPKRNLPMISPPARPPGGIVAYGAGGVNVIFRY